MIKIHFPTQTIVNIIFGKNGPKIANLAYFRIKFHIGKNTYNKYMTRYNSPGSRFMSTKKS